MPCCCWVCTVCVKSMTPPFTSPLTYVCVWPAYSDMPDSKSVTHRNKHASASGSLGIRSSICSNVKRSNNIKPFVHVRKVAWRVSWKGHCFLWILYFPAPVLIEAGHLFFRILLFSGFNILVPFLRLRVHHLSVFLFILKYTTSEHFRLTCTVHLS